MKLQRSFYIRNNVIQVAQELLGKHLCTRFGNTVTSGIIIETEAYAGVTDKASHAYNGRRTERTEVMYSQGGTAYVYLCYGMYSLFNVVTNVEGTPHAILIRAIYPTEGIAEMEKRRKMKAGSKNFSGGPGTLCIALGIHYKQHSGLDLTKSSIWIEDKKIRVRPSAIIKGPRVGVAYAEEDALLPYRFILSKW
jgi:DNA-3-methyladenine glycosylase